VAFWGALNEAIRLVRRQRESAAGRTELGRSLCRCAGFAPCFLWHTWAGASSCRQQPEPVPVALRGVAASSGSTLAGCCSTAASAAPLPSPLRDSFQRNKYTREAEKRALLPVLRCVECRCRAACRVRFAVHTAVAREGKRPLEGRELAGATCCVLLELCKARRVSV